MYDKTPSQNEPIATLCPPQLLHTGPVARRVICPTFVGRESELARLEQVAECARQQAQLVVVSGDAGVGKTRLIEELCRRRDAAGALTAVAGCVQLGSVGLGYAPLLGLLRQLRTSIGAQEFHGLLDQVAPQLRPLLTSGGAEVGTPDAVREQTMALLESVGERSPGAIVVFEDMQWADASTRDLIAFAGRRLRAARIVVVVTYRTEDVHRGDPLRGLVAELARMPHVEHVRLTGLTRDELQLLLAAIAEAVPPTAALDDVMARSEGNPFYAEELWSARAHGRELPDSLRDVILARIARLPADVQALLHEAALLTGALDDRLLSAMSRRIAADVTALLRTAVSDQVLVMDRGECRFRHTLVREALYEQLLPGQRRRLHRAIAEALATDADLIDATASERWALVAYHWGAAGARPEELAARVRAGLEAQRIGALADAGDHFERAALLWADIPDAEGLAGMDEAELLSHAAAARTGSGSPESGAALAERALESLPSGSEPERRAELLERIGYHYWAAGDLVRSGQAREQAVALLAGRPPSQVQAAALTGLGRQHMVSFRYLEAEEVLRRAVAMAEATRASASHCEALAALGVVLTNLGKADEGMAAGHRAVEIGKRCGTADNLSGAYVNLTACLLAAGRYDQVAPVGATGLEHAKRWGMLASDGALLIGNMAEAFCQLGQWDAATALLESSAGDIDGVYGLEGAIVAARIALWRGRAEEAARYAERALAVADPESDSQAYIASAEVAAAEGREADARRLAAIAMDAVLATDDLYLAARTCTTAIGIEADRVETAPLARGRAQLEVEEAQRTADELLERVRHMVDRVVCNGVTVLPETRCWLEAAQAERMRAYGESDAAAWSEVAAGFETMGLPYPAAAARFREAQAHLSSRSGRKRAAVAAKTAHALAGRLGATRLAEQIHNLAERGRLDMSDPAETLAPEEGSRAATLGISAREAEVLRLLTLGQTNRQIAETLCISEKTASAHVTHLLRKLSVTNRIEAAALAHHLEEPG